MSLIGEAGLKSQKNSRKIETVPLFFFIALILVVTFTTFLPCLKNGFINWDDPQYILKNPVVKDMSWLNVKLAFSHFFVANYQPLTIVSYMFDYRLFGLNPFGYHLVNLILHLLNCIFVFWFIYILTQNKGTALITAILFGVHPLHVESVAWISERKDVLYSLFFLAAMICYVYYLRKKQKMQYYCLSIFLFILSLLSKAMAITLPLALFLIDYFIRRKRDKGAIIDKVPFFALSFIFSFIAVIAQYSAGAVRGGGASFFKKIGCASYSFVFYLFKIFIPAKLSCLYAYIDIRNFSLDSIFLYSFFIIFVLLGLLLFSAGYTRKIIFGGLLFTVIIFPTLQFVPIGGTVVADRYIYLASIGIFYLIAEGFVWLFSKKSKFSNIMRPFLIVFLSAAIAIFSILAWNRCKVWKDSISLWSDVLRKYPKGVETVYNNIGNAYNETGEYAKARIMFRQAIKINPKFAMAYVNLGNSYKELGEPEESVAAYKKAIAIDENSLEAYFNLGNSYKAMGKIAESVNAYKKTIQLDQNFVEAYYNLGVLYNNSGNKEGAISMFRKAIGIAPFSLPAYSNLVQIYKEQAREQEVILLYEKAIANNLQYFDAYFFIGNLYSQAGKDKEAVKLFKKAIKINPNAAEGYASIGSSYCSIGKDQEAVFYLKKALRINPGLAAAYNNLAAAYYYLKKYNLAVENCDKAIELGYKVAPKFQELLKPYRK